VFAPASFRLPVDAPNNDVCVPLKAPGKDDKGSTYLFCIAKLRAGVAQSRLDEELKTIQERFARHDPSRNIGESVLVMPALRVVVDSIRRTLLLLLGAAGALLLISCGNVAGVLLARSVARARETAVRVALGATPPTGAPIFFRRAHDRDSGRGSWSSCELLGGSHCALARRRRDPRADQIRLNGPVLLFTLAVAIACALLFSLAPLWQARRAQPHEVLSDGARTSAGQRSRGLSLRS